MKRLLITTVLSLFALTAVAESPSYGGSYGGKQGGYGKSANQEQRRQNRQEEHLKGLTEALNLNEAQVESVKKVLEEQREARRALRDSTHEQMKEKHQAMQEQTKEKLGGVLSEIQLLQYEAFNKGMNMGRPPHGRGMQSGKGMGGQQMRGQKMGDQE
ncbi:hypothetical protein ACFL2V_09665 [Pseudomonadota bacterium]